MARVVGIGHQNFGEVIQGGCFYVDKTAFIKEWWENQDAVTLITRPRRFGKTLNMSMMAQFFSVEYAGRGDLFEGLSIWREEKYRQLQGTYPVISLSFAKVKEKSFSNARKKICFSIKELYNQYDFLLESACLNGDEKAVFRKVSAEMEEYIASESLNILSNYLSRYYEKKVIILLDEYDTPMQEAYVGGYWQEMVAFMGGLFNAAFKTNPYLERALLTGITRISIASYEALESLFSDLNNLEVVTTTAGKYETAFGFTEEEVFAALDEYGMGDKQEDVKRWYDGFVFGKIRDIYNPWSILNFLEKGELAAYWVNTSSNSLAGKLLREGNGSVKATMEGLLKGESFRAQIDEQTVFSQLDEDEDAIWSLLLATGYLKAEGRTLDAESGVEEYTLSLTNLEVRAMFRGIIRRWFRKDKESYNGFVKALLLGDVDEMNTYMNQVALATFSSFDTGRNPSGDAKPERFYHGFVLGLMVELADIYVITSNRESGFGRYDVMLEPKGSERDAIIIEFKAINPRREASLEDTMRAALAQIEEKKYEAALLEKGFPAERIRKYGFAFRGKEVLIG